MIREQTLKLTNANEKLGLLRELVGVIKNFNINERDVVSSIEIFEDLLSFHLDLNDFEEFFKCSRICLETLVGIVENPDMFDSHTLLILFKIFDDLVLLANQWSNLTQSHLELPGNITTFILVNRSETAKSTNQLILSVIDGQTGVDLAKFKGNSQVAVGILSGFDSFQLLDASINGTFVEGDTSRTYYLASHIVSISSTQYLQNEFEVRLDIKTRDVPHSEVGRMCVFLSSTEERPRRHIWKSTGCILVGRNQTHTRCICNHLTNFAVLMQVNEFKLSMIHEISLEVITKIGCSVSIAALITSLLVLIWLRVQTDRYVLLMNLMFAIILAQVVFLTGIDAVKNQVVCRAVAILLHYLYLTVFTLMLAQGIHLYHKLYRAFEPDTSLSMFIWLGWGSPVAIITISVITNLEGYGTEQRCWLSTDGPVWAFVGPALTVISINMAILVMTIRTFLGVKFNAKKTDIDKFKASVRATLILLPLLGITWMFGIVAVNGSTVAFQYVFAILNSMQGLFIFLFHVVFNEDVKNACGKYKGRVITLLSSRTPRVIRHNNPCSNTANAHMPQFRRRSDNRKDS